MASIPRYRLQPPSRWFTAFCLLIACGCLAASYWQHRRATLKQDLQDQAAAWLDTPPLTVADLASDAALLWRPATVTGSYDTDAQLLVDNRIHQHRAGFHVVTPLRLPDGRWLLVNRGWLAAPADRATVRAPAAPAGAVTVSGLFAPDNTGAFELAEDTGANGIWQHLVIERWSERTGHDALPAVLLADDASEGLVAVARAPDYRANVSRGYRLQWLAFAAIAIGGWLAVSLRPPNTA